MPFDTYEDDPYAMEDEDEGLDMGQGRFASLRASAEPAQPDFGPMTMEDADMRYEYAIPENPVVSEAEQAGHSQADFGGSFHPQSPEQPAYGQGGMGQGMGMPGMESLGPGEDITANNQAVSQAIKETLQEKARMRQEATQKFREQVRNINGGSY